MHSHLSVHHHWLRAWTMTIESLMFFTQTLDFYYSSTADQKQSHWYLLTLLASVSQLSLQLCSNMLHCSVINILLHPLLLKTNQQLIKHCIGQVFIFKSFFYFLQNGRIWRRQEGQQITNMTQISSLIDYLLLRNKTLCKEWQLSR